jgi:hypothetical protein
VARQAGEAGDGAEENIVYLWLYCHYFSKQTNKNTGTFRRTFLPPLISCVCDCLCPNCIKNNI